VDVVIGVGETHGRADTAALIGGLEQAARRRIEYRGVVLEEMDLDFPDVHAFGKAPARSPRRDASRFAVHGVACESVHRREVGGRAYVLRGVVGDVFRSSIGRRNSAHGG
jgi:hypothetical protein